MVALGLFVGCDLSDAPAPIAPQIVGTYPLVGAREVPRQVAIRVRYDRPLLSASVSRATVRMRSGPLEPFLEVWVDPVDNAIVAQPFGGAALAPRLTYLLTVDGVRDLDGVPVEPYELRFDTGEALGSVAAVGQTPWATVETLFDAHCVEGCHDGSPADGGLDLSSYAAVAQTAIGIPARQTGATALRDQRGLGGMPRIDSGGDPANSYLIYKMLADPHVLGAPMPPEGPLERDAIAAVADWIAGGAQPP